MASVGMWTAPSAAVLCLHLQDLGRACVSDADAVLVLCNKCPADAHQEDTTNTMILLSIGQYMQKCAQHRSAKPNNVKSFADVCRRLLLNTPRVAMVVSSEVRKQLCTCTTML